MALAIWLAVAEEDRLRAISRATNAYRRLINRPLLLPEKSFMAQFRLKKSNFEELCQNIIPLLPETQRSSAVRPEIKILAAVNFLAHGSYQKSIGAYECLNLSQTMVSLCVRDVTNALNQPGILTEYIKFPRTQTQREGIARGFMDSFGMPGVVGCIDGTHVAIIRPSSDEEIYFNRKRYHSLNVLIICDSNLRILHVDASFGGQSHDSHVWNNCPVKPYLMQLHEEGEACWLLGDSGYAQGAWMMTPIVGAARNSPEEHYTKVHIRARNVVERCIGVLKTRWRCLLAHRTLHYDPIKAGKMVNACVVLHNMINDSRIAIDEVEMRRDRRRQPSTQSPIYEPRLVDIDRQALVERLWRSRSR